MAGYRKKYPPLLKQYDYEEYSFCNFCFIGYT